MTKLVKKMLAAFLVVLCLFGSTIPTFAAEYKYDALGRVIEVIYDSGQTVSYTYDAAGNILSITTSNGSADGGKGGSSGRESGRSNSGSTTSYPKQLSVTAPGQQRKLYGADTGLCEVDGRRRFLSACAWRRNSYNTGFDAADCHEFRNSHNNDVPDQYRRAFAGHSGRSSLHGYSE